jgi:hypothetical protein
MTTPTPCEQWIERLSAYADGELPQPECLPVDQHLAGCEACREWLRLVREDARRYREAYAEQARGEAYLKGVMGTLPARQEGQPGRRGFRFTFAEVTLLSLIVVIVGALTFPVFSRAREKGRVLACKSNLRQMKAVSEGLSLGARDRNYGLADKLHLSYDAALTVHTDDAQMSLRSAGEIVREQGGFVLQADFRKAGRLASATLSCKVPAEDLEATLAAFQGLGATVSQQLAGQDLTQDYVAVQTALRREQDKHTRLSAEAESTGQRAQRADAQAAVEQSEERTLENRRKEYEVLSRTVLASVSATFESHVPRPSARALTASALRSGWHWSSRTLGVAGAWALGFAPVWVPVVLVVGLIRWQRRRRAGGA